MLAHIPDASINVDSAPSRALYHTKTQLSLNKHSPYRCQAYPSHKQALEYQPDLLLKNHCCWVSIAPIFKTCCTFLLQQGKEIEPKYHNQTIYKELNFYLAGSNVVYNSSFQTQRLFNYEENGLIIGSHTLKSMRSAVFLKK